MSCVAFKEFLTVKVYVFDRFGYYSLLYEQVLRGRFCNTVAHIYAYTALCTFAFVSVAFSWCYYLEKLTIQLCKQGGKSCFRQNLQLWQVSSAFIPYNTYTHTPAHTLDGDKLAVRSCLNAPHSPTHTYINPVPQPWTGHRLLHLSILHWDSCRMHTHVLTLLQTGWRNYFSALRFLFSPLSLSDTHTRIHTRSLSFQPEETVLAGRKNRSKSTLQLVVFRRSKCTWTRTGFKMEIQGGSGGRGVKDK